MTTYYHMKSKIAGILITNINIPIHFIILLSVSAPADGLREAGYSTDIHQVRLVCFAVDWTDRYTRPSSKTVWYNISRIQANKSCTVIFFAKFYRPFGRVLVRVFADLPFEFKKLPAKI